MKNLRFVTLTALFLAFAVIVSAQSVETVAKIEGISQDVKIRRDARGIPYIEAQTDADLYFAQGYATAQDRLWQMDLTRRAARGETAEIFGNLTLEEDKRWRKLGFAEVVERSFAQTSPELKKALENYARGVNAFIASLNESNLPPEFKLLQYRPREWRPTDSIIIGKILADGLSSTWQNDLLRAKLQKSLSPEKYKDATEQNTPWDVILFDKGDKKKNPQKLKAESVANVSEQILAFAEADARIRQKSLERIGLYAEELAASNNWVISGKRTADGSPILANDPHLPPTAPGVWYLAHLASPSSRVAGVTFPGVPGVILGHNEFIAWGATNVGPDVQDLYLETFNAEGKYKTPTGWESAKIRQEKIKVRKNPFSTETEDVTLEVAETRNGTIYAEADGRKYALRWTARDPRNQEFEAFFLLNRAKNWTDFQNALKTYGGATQNFVYADVKGNIGWIAAGRIPLRKTGDGAYPYDGATDDGEWTGYIPFAELPTLYNPPSGFIVTANQKIVGDKYPYAQMSRDAAAPWRARRIYDLISKNPKMTIADTIAVQRDSYAIPHKILADEILKLNAASPETLATLKAWDGKMTADSKAALLINQIRVELANKIADENKPLPSYLVRERVLRVVLSEKPARWLPKEFADYAALFKFADVQARQNLAKRYGADEAKWTWGMAFKANFPHPLAVAPLVGAQFQTPNIGIDGSGVTPNVGSSVSMRFVASPLNWDATRHVIPLGQSGVPSSPHFKDQFDSWNKGDLPVFPFSKAATEKAAKEVLTLKAEKAKSEKR